MKAMKKILVVDDAAFMQKTIISMLAGEYETICASSGEEALALYEKEKPDLILTDLIMPGMTGLELQRVLRERYQEQVPIIFISADENEENETRGLESGALDFIRKPFRKAVLLRRVGNIMRQMEQIQGLRIVAETDPMTGLYNKTHTQDVMMKICGQRAGTLMMVDLDSFKLVNDLYGHAMGDRVLIRFAEILRGVIRGSDIAGRMGGDEFFIFCQDIREESVIAEKTRQINKLLLSSAKEFMGEDMPIPLGASIGAVVTPDEGSSFPDLYKKADKALYRVKQHGKHGYAFYRGGASQAGPEKTSSTTLDYARAVLEERNRQKGAYELDFENFRSVYRFLIRTIENYHRRVELLLLTIQGAGNFDTPEEAADRFGEALGISLRRSDVYTRNGASQYIVLLSETGGENEEIIRTRIMGTWRDIGGEGRPEVFWEGVDLNV